MLLISLTHVLTTDLTIFLLQLSGDLDHFHLLIIKIRPDSLGFMLTLVDSLTDLHILVSLVEHSISFLFLMSFLDELNHTFISSSSLEIALFIGTIIHRIVVHFYVVDFVIFSIDHNMTLLVVSSHHVIGGYFFIVVVDDVSVFVVNHVFFFMDNNLFL